jgi:putative ABC transport system substrate-binding protein
MRSRIVSIIVILALGSLTASLPAEAQEAGKVFRIGYLTPIPTPPRTSFVWEAFLQGLRERGWREGKNIVIERRSSEGRYERLPDLTAELVQLRVDVLVVVGAAATRAAVEATTKIPIVSMGVQDPVRLGFVQSLARPGGNITGPALFAGLAIAGKQLELLKETVPKVSRVAVLWNSANPMHAPLLRETEVAARALKVKLQPLEVSGPDEFDSAFAAMTRERAGALFVPADPVFVAHRKRLADLAAKHRLPALYGVASHVMAGGLMAYATSLADMFSRAADYVDKILKGAKPADLPMEQPTKFELIINLKTAKALGLAIPESILIRSDKVIE